MNQDVKVYIDNFRVDVSKTSVIQIKKQFSDVKEISKKKTSFTKPIDVLYTTNNSSLLKSAFNINEVGGWDRNSRPVARIEAGGSTIFEGFAKLVSILSMNYSFVIYANNVNLETAFGDTLIKGNTDSSYDISITNQYAFDFTRANLRTLLGSEPRTDGLGINYGYAEMLGRLGENDYINDRLFIPSIAAKELLQEIMWSIGKTITFSPEITKYINHLYIPYNGEISALQNEWEIAKYTIYGGTLAGLLMYGITPLGQLLCNYNKIDDRTNVTNPDEYSINFTEGSNGTYKLNINIAASRTVTTAEENLVISVKIRNNVTSEIIDVELKNTTSLNPDTYGDPISFEVGSAYETATFEGEFTTNSNSYVIVVGYEPNDNITINLGNENYFTLTKLDALYNEDNIVQISADNILPVDYKKKDLFNDIVLLFNAVAEESGDNIHLKTSDEFINDSSRELRDYSEAIDEETLKYETVLSAKGEINQFKFGVSDDKYNQDFNEKFGYNIADLLREDDVKTIVTKQMVSANTVRVGKFSSLINTEGLNTRLAPRLLFINDITLSLMKFGQDTHGGRTTTISHMHILSNRFDEDTTATDNLVLSFNNEYTYSSLGENKKGTDGTIYSRFHKGEEELKVNDDAIVLTADFNMSDKQFGEIGYNDIVFINTAKHGGGNFMLNEITKHYVGYPKFSTAEFIQIDLDNLNYDFKASEINLIQISV